MDLISRHDAIEVVRKWFDKMKLNGDICIDGIISLPSAQTDLITQMQNGIKATDADNAYSYRWEEAEEYQRIINRFMSFASAQPEIVRCKDCKHRPIEKDGEIMPPKEDDWKCPCLCDDYFYSRRPKDNFFCASGERREE